MRRKGKKKEFSVTPTFKAFSMSIRLRRGTHKRMAASVMAVFFQSFGADRLGALAVFASEQHLAVMAGHLGELQEERVGVGRGGGHYA